MNKKSTGEIKEKWGAYAPPASSFVLRGLVSAGVARGGVGKLIRKAYVKLYPNIVDAERDGVRYRLNIIDNVTDNRILLSSKHYDGVEIDWLLSGKQGVFIDIGANTGYYALKMAQGGFETVIAIEPNPATLSRLEFNVAANFFGEKIAIVPVCIGNGDLLELYENEGDLGSVSLHPLKEGEAASLKIASAPLLEIVKTHGISHIDGLKIDIEGFEDQALIPFFEQAPQKLWPEKIVIEHCNQERWEVNVIDDYLLQGRYKIFKKLRANMLLERI